MYEILHDMGIKHPEEIEKYTLRQEGDEDILKIYFKRQKGSLFAKSMKFKHGRAKKMVLVDSGSHEYKEVSEISPTILQATRELDSIVHNEAQIADVRARILNDLDHLEEVMKRKLDQLRRDIEQLK